MWNKFKYWLIEKLGGYVAPCARCNEYKTALLQIDRGAAKLTTLVDINAHPWFDNTPEKKRIEIGKIYVLDQMRKLLKDSDFIKYEYKEDRILCGTLIVCRQP